MPLPDNIRSVQPGGGVCYSLELAWGRLRRRWLKGFRPGYVERMARCRQGETTGAPHEIVDPRDLKYCSNLCTAHWKEEDDRFAYRDRLPVVRWGLAELQIMGWPLLLGSLILAAMGGWFWIGAVLLLVPLALIVYFFRDPKRTMPDDPLAIVSPADGTIAEVTPVEHYDFLGGPAVRIGIFLSIFNVHVNRSPCAGTVLEMDYRPGEFLNALRPESAIRNESMWIGLEHREPERGRFAVRQISGLIARRIVCALRPGQQVARGEKFGMIKLGSRTELILPQAAVAVEVKPGDVVHAGSTVLARYQAASPS